MKTRYKEGELLRRVPEVLKIRAVLKRDKLSWFVMQMATATMKLRTAALRKVPRQSCSLVLYNSTFDVLSNTIQRSVGQHVTRP